jgi:hypothetical protein
MADRWYVARPGPTGRWVVLSSVEAQDAQHADWEVITLIAESECALLRDWRERTMPLIAALAVYGERANLAALVEKARALNEAKP